MRSSDDRGIGFLLSIVTLPLAACPSDDADATASGDSTSADDDGDDDDASMTVADSSSSGPGPITDPTESSGPGPTESSGASPTTSSDGGSESGVSSETGVTTETESDTDTTGGEPACPADIEIPDVCNAYAETILACLRDRDYEPALFCACYIGYYGPMYGAACGPAFEDYFACIAAATCEQIMGRDETCSEEVLAVMEECGF